MSVELNNIIFKLTLRRINRNREESLDRAPRTLTKLTYTPVKPGPSCLYVMEVSFVGPLNDLVPLGASCPLPWGSSLS